eukprot:TRINITY_DN82163_c0_g1_i1.p1 TRINITY_DN82163_c0_g1~~TRINITY_DN82163_c0_g1_i1.p1  ORF type:complete len:184 (+),score=30.28 TRINITY_DN82163_c0_g1_i1:74-625(+)
MSAKLMQQGSAGPMRDLDYINPRPPKQSSALPPEVRAMLLGRRRASSCPPAEIDEKKVIYKGAANAEPKVGASGAGTNWVNPNGHAFVRKGSGLPRHVKQQLSGGGYSGGGYSSGSGASMTKLASEPARGGSPSSATRTSSRESGTRPPLLKGRVSSKEGGARGQAGRPPQAPMRPDSVGSDR